MKHREAHCLNGRPSPEYKSWCCMRQRCLNARYSGYKNYGGRGITIDPVWSDYLQFLDDMGRKPSAQHSLERKNNNLGYRKCNCEWATKSRQSQNKRTTKLSQNQIIQIRTLYATGKYYQYNIAAQFHISRTHVSNITRGARWL